MHVFRGLDAQGRQVSSCGRRRRHAGDRFAETLIVQEPIAIALCKRGYEATVCPACRDIESTGGRS